MEAFTSRWKSFWVKHDPDTLFSYSTFKMVTIQDRYLEFLKTEDAAGIVRLSLVPNNLAPSVDEGTENYCYTTPSSSENRLPCTFPSIDQLGDGQGTSLFISSYINRTDYVASCDTFLPGCTSSVANTSNYYVGNIMSVSLSIDHSAQVNYGNKAPKGILQTVDKDGGNEWSKCKDSFSADVISMSDIMRAAHLDLATLANKYLEGTEGYTPQSFRRFGAVLLLFVEYDNAENYFSKNPPIVYRYKPLLILDVDDYFTGTIYTDFPYARTVLYRKGIRIIGIISGDIGHFTFQTLLIQLTTSLALMKVATTAVDLIALYVLPDKFLYRTAKFEKTEDFSDLHEKKRRKDLVEAHSRELSARELTVVEEARSEDDGDIKEGATNT